MNDFSPRDASKKGVMLRGVRTSEVWLGADRDETVQHAGGGLF
jgi:hypothetical protein